jgi:hypothetical protein
MERADEGRLGILPGHDFIIMTLVFPYAWRGGYFHSEQPALVWAVVPTGLKSCELGRACESGCILSIEFFNRIDCLALLLTVVSASRRILGDQ